MKYSSKTWIGVALAGALLLSGIFLAAKKAYAPTVSEPAASTVQAIDSRSMASMIADKNFTLINVHVPYEGAIEKTDSFVAYDTIEASAGKLPRDKNAKIVVYCKTGSMSRTAADKLIDMGYTSIYDLTGGMEAWQAAGYALQNKQEEG